MLQTQHCLVALASGLVVDGPPYIYVIVVFVFLLFPAAFENGGFVVY